jgi:N-methylhydantoinase B
VFDNRLLERDVFEVIPNPGAGYGDPMLREAETVVAEVGEGRLTADEARSIYGVDLGDDGALASGHEEFRDERRRARLAEAAAPLEAVAGKLAERDGLALATVAHGRDDSGEGVLGCAHCDQALAPREGNYRLGAARLEQPMTALGAHFLDPQRQVGHELIFRSYLCPGCGTALDGEVCKPGDAPHWDVKLAP